MRRLFFTVVLAAIPYGVPAATIDAALVAPADRGVASDVATGRSLRNVRDLGRIGASEPITVGLLMRVRNLTELQQLTLLQGDLRSPMFHHYLTRDQWTQSFAPDAATYAQTQAALRRRGFRILRTYQNRAYIEAQAPAAVVERYFRTEIHAVEQLGKGRRYLNVTAALMPAELRSSVISVSGLHSIQMVTHPMRLRSKAAVSSSPVYSAGLRPFNVPTPLSTATPGENPSPDPTLSPGDPTSDYTDSDDGYDPTIYADAYDYPVQHGYGGSGHAMASVIEADFLNSDANLEFATFGIPRAAAPATITRLCADPAPSANCDGTIGAADPEGESTLDALTMMSLAPKAPFYEAIAPAFSDEQLEAAYEIHLNLDVADAVSSSFGECETDDPAFAYATDYIAMEGAALGMSFEASTGDIGAGECGTYSPGATPQELVSISVPSAGYYFTAIGGTQFSTIATCGGIGNGSVTSPCYTHEDAWASGNGGYSARELVPCWQSAALTQYVQTTLSVGSTTMRNTPDLVFTADGDSPYAGMEVIYNGAKRAFYGTSVGSPMWTAMQVEINQVQGSRNGWVNPGLYAAYAATESLTESYAFRDIITGNNGEYTAVPGYDDASGLGSPLGFKLAGIENGYAASNSCPT